MGPITGTLVAFGVILALGYFMKSGGVGSVTVPHMAVDSLKWPAVIGGLILSMLLLWILLSPFDLIFWGIVTVVGGHFLSTHLLPSDWGNRRRLPVLLGISMIAFGIYQSGLGKWTSRQWEGKVEKCLGTGKCPSPPQTTQPRIPDRVTVGYTGSIVAPKSRKSAWQDLPQKDLCVRIWTDQPSKSDLILEYQDESMNEYLKVRNGVYLHTKDQHGNEPFTEVRGVLRNIVAFRVKSKLVAPVTVHHDSWKRDNGRCLKL